ncbi:MAG: insulinase family protein [Sphingobacteriaceae bacterium]|nr:MAG: insulinase family protein [Sphingobacteriaceae bacterium]
MKKYIFALFIAFTAVNVKPALAQHEAYEMMVSGVKVIVQPTKNEIVEIQTIIKGGVQNYPASKAGIESMAISALTECGTLEHDKNSFKNILDKLSAQVYGNSNKNFSVVRMNCLKEDFETVWPLYTEALTLPKFDAKEFTRVKQDAINQLKENESDPDAAIDKFADSIAFAGRDYAKNPAGTSSILQKLTPEETKNYYRSILTRSRMLIVVVANLDKATIEKKIEGLLAGIKQGAPFELRKSSFRIYKNTFNAAPKDYATNYVEGITGGPQPGTKNFNAFSVAMRIFADRHFLDVRTKNALSYAPQAWFSTGATAVARVSVSTTEPNKYIAVFDKLVDSIKTRGFKAEEVANMKVTYLTGFYYKNETNSAQATSIAFNEVLHNNWKRSLTLVNDVKKLTVDDINTAFRNYIGNTTWVYQGDTKKVNPVLFINGTLKKAENGISH